MFVISALEVAVLLLWTAGIVFAVLGAVSRLFDLRETIVAITIAVFVPVIGSIGSIALYAHVTRRMTGLVSRGSI